MSLIITNYDSFEYTALPNYLSEIITPSIPIKMYTIDDLPSDNFFINTCSATLKKLTDELYIWNVQITISINNTSADKTIGYAKYIASLPLENYVPTITLDKTVIVLIQGGIKIINDESSKVFGGKIEFNLSTWSHEPKDTQIIN